MQLSSLANGMGRLDSRKLFFSQKSELKSRIKRPAQCASFKKLLSRLLVLFFLSLHAQALLAEGASPQITNPETGAIVGQKSGVGSLATEIITNESASVANEINMIIATKHHPYLLRSDFQNRTEDIAALYQNCRLSVVMARQRPSGKKYTRSSRFVG